MPFIGPEYASQHTTGVLSVKTDEISPIDSAYA
jgi:hypothetical protein